MIYVFYGLLIIYCFLFIVFWTELEYIKILRYPRKIIYYFFLNQSWAVFATPYKFNKSLLLNIEYEDKKKELVNLFDCENMTFINRKANTFDKKYAACLIDCLELRVIFAYYIKNYIQKDKNKKIKKIDFIEKIEKIKLWESNDIVDFMKISSHKF